MRKATIEKYLSELEREEKRITSPSDPAVPGLRAFIAYHPNAHVQFLNIDGRTYWMTRKMMRIAAIALRVSGSGEQMTTIRAIAAEARVSPGYASKVLQRLMRWSMVTSVVSRGRYGGIYLIKVRNLVEKARGIVSRFNVSSVSSVRKVLRQSSSSMVETLSAVRPFTREELQEFGL